jgi:xanthine dehydrogenase molybdopterin-binding subunit B
MDIVRSPYAYAKIKNINIEAAMKVPGVVAVVTGRDLEKYNLHWMPTLMSDTQMVLPTDTVMYQAQEVAAVIATTKYAARDGREAVIVEYEPMNLLSIRLKRSIHRLPYSGPTSRVRKTIISGIGKLATSKKQMTFLPKPMWW